jgi:hypothetical protein
MEKKTEDIYKTGEIFKYFSHQLNPFILRSLDEFTSGILYLSLSFITTPFMEENKRKN